MPVSHHCFNIHGDNIVECVRAFNYIVNGLGALARDIVGPTTSVTCPVYTLYLDDRVLRFQFLPGYGERRWNQDILGFIKRSGGRLREAADAIITRVQEGKELPIAAIEFCGALPAGNQAWQRQGRAFSFAHAKIPFFYVAELGGFELDADRGRKAERMPNPAIPFSFFSMTQYTGSVCMPVYEANAGATTITTSNYASVFGKTDFLEFIKHAVLGQGTHVAGVELGRKCIALVVLLADAKKRQDGLSGRQWQSAHDAMNGGQTLPDFLAENIRLPWKKKAYIDGLTATAKRFMDLGAASTFGLTSSTLPLSFVPKHGRADFCRDARLIYPDMDIDFSEWLANDERHLAISWVMGFKPGGDDARPDRGLPPLARMLIGDNTCELMTFVYGPAPASHWKELAKNPVQLASQNGLWEAVLGVSDGLLVDSATKPSVTPRGYCKAAWAAVLAEDKTPLDVKANVLSLGEQDVDTALHVAFASLGTSVAFEGMCNPPGGDWSGISFRWDRADPEHRWLTLPRVSADGAKRPDHVFALFGHGERTVCLCIESKEKAEALDADIGPRLTRYTTALFDSTPSIHRGEKTKPWAIYDTPWKRRDVAFLSAGAYLSRVGDPFRGLPNGTGLDLQIGVSFSEVGQQCTLHFRGDTIAGHALVNHLGALRSWGAFVKIEVSS